LEKHLEVRQIIGRSGGECLLHLAQFTYKMTQHDRVVYATVPVASTVADFGSLAREALGKMVVKASMALLIEVVVVVVVVSGVDARELES
jgi:hypothetical protein